MPLQPLLILSSIQAVTLRLLPGEDLKAALDTFATEHHLKAACIISCVGSLQTVAIRYANVVETEIQTARFEIVSLSGTLAETGSHLHICISDSTGKAIGGHLKEGSIIYTTAEIVIGIFPGLSYERETDVTYGFKELVVKSQ